jgi:SWIM zinc finger
MDLTLEQVLQMAPDEASAAAGKKLQAAKFWQSLGQNEHAFWGECQGSAIYQIKVDLSNLGYKCSCPSRKFPCKHVLGLFLLAVSNRHALLEQSSPQWVAEWLAKRQEAATKKETKAAEKEIKPVDDKAQHKRAEQRHERVREGLELLDIWLKDLVRGGLAGLEAKGTAPWVEQARRLVDAQAPGLALRIRRLGELPGSGPEWPRVILGELGRIKLALHAFQRIDQLEPALASDLRQWIGWTVTSEELEKVGEKVIDNWMILGQWIDEDDKLRVQRTWCLGSESKRLALILQFAIGTAAFPIPLTPGMQQRGAMIYYPGAGRQRAQFAIREEQIVPIKTVLAGHAGIEVFLLYVAATLARQPWLHAFGCLLQQVTLARSNERWFVRDGAGQSLPLIDFDAWKLLALSGGYPFDLAGEWDGFKLRPLGAFLEGAYRLV